MQKWLKWTWGGATALWLGGIWFIWDLADRLINWGYWTVEETQRHRTTPIIASVLWTALFVVAGLLVWKGRPLWRWLTFFGENLRLLFLGQVDLHRRVNESADAALFSRIAGVLRYRGDNYHIVYTHKGQHPRKTTKAGNYRIPGFPLDEVDVIMYVWYLISRNFGFTLNQIRPRCSCSIDEEKDRQDVLDSAYTLIGSPKGNRFCLELMRTLRNPPPGMQRPPYIMRLERVGMRDLEDHPDSDTVCEDPKWKDDGAHEIRCVLQGRTGAPLRPIPTANAADGADMRDYALLMRISGKLSKYPVLIIAGCKVAGQTALTEFLQERKQLEWLSETFGGEDFYVVLSVEYKYNTAGLPDIDRYDVVDSGAIRWETPKSS